MNRQIVPIGWVCTPVVAPGKNVPLADWLAKQARRYGVDTLLAHADDGVIWGLVQDGKLLTSGDAERFPEVSPPLRWLTLLEARLFGRGGELYLWRADVDVYQARWLADAPAADGQWSYDEAQILWGDHAVAGAADPDQLFTLVEEGQRGLRHAMPLAPGQIPFVPVNRADDPWHPLRLGVRHYLEADGSGVLVEVHSRLRGLSAVPYTGGVR